MKTQSLIFSFLFFAANLFGQSPYLGGRTKITSMHPTTNHFLAIMGDSTNAPYRNVPTSNVLEILRGLSSWENSGNVAYVRTNGNDATALRGRTDKPFLTVTGANAAVIAGDLMDIGPGLFDVNTNQFNFKHGVTYSGAGEGVTIIEGRRTNGFIQFITGEAVIQDFTLRSRPQAAFFGLMFGADYSDNGDLICTNFSAQRIHFDGETDCLYWQGLDDPKTRHLEFNQCRFTTGFDLIYAAAGTTNTSFRFKYCDFEADLTSRTNTANVNRLTKWITVGNGGPAANMVFEHCTYRVINALYSYVLEAGDGSPFDSSFYHFTFLNCAVQQSVTNGGLAVGTILTQGGTNVTAVFNNVTDVPFNTNAPIFSSPHWPSVINMTSGIRRTNLLPAITFNGRTNMTGLEIEIRDGFGNAGTSNITVAGQSGARIDGSLTYTIDRDWGAVRLRNQGTNWVVVRSSIANSLALSSSLTVGGNAAFDTTTSFGDEMTISTLKMFLGPFGSTVLLGINPDGYLTNVTIGSGISLAADMTLSATGGSGGPSTNAPPFTLTLTGTGSTNIIINWLALGATNSVRCTVTANFAIVHTNIIDGKHVMLETIEDATGTRTGTTNPSYPPNNRIGVDVTGFDVATNATYRSLIRFYGSSTNAQLIGNVTGFAP